MFGRNYLVDEKIDEKITQRYIVLTRYIFAFCQSFDFKNLMTTDGRRSYHHFFKQNVSISATYVIDNEILKCSSQQQDPRRKINSP